MAARIEARAGGDEQDVRAQGLREQKRRRLTGVEAEVLPWRIVDNTNPASFLQLARKRTRAETRVIAGARQPRVTEVWIRR